MVAAEMGLSSGRRSVRCPASEDTAANSEGMGRRAVVGEVFLGEVVFSNTLKTKQGFTRSRLSRTGHRCECGPGVLPASEDEALGERCMSSCDVYSGALGQTPGDEVEDVVFIPYPVKAKKWRSKRWNHWIKVLQRVRHRARIGSQDSRPCSFTGWVSGELIGT